MRRAATLGLAALLLGAALVVAQLPSPVAADAFGAVAGSPPLGTVTIPRPVTVDPFPLRRVLASADRLPALLKLLPPGPVVTLDRAAFEAQARAAAATPARPPARLQEARYAATHSADGLRGTLTWRFAAGPGEDFALDALGVALAADAGGRVVTHAAKGPTLRLPESGEATLNWSARGTPEGDAERFDLLLPPAPLASLDLDLPADREPSLTAGPPGRALSGPLPGAAPGRQSRRVQFPGVGRVELVLRPVPASAERGAPVALSRVARYEFTPGVVTFAFDCALEAARAAPDEMVFLVDPRCHVTEVASATRVAWTVEGAPPRLRVRCPDGLPAKLTVAGFLALSSAEGNWPLPDLQLVGGLPGGDAVEVTCRPDVRWLGCDPGDYRSHALPPTPTPDDGVRYGFQAVPSERGATAGAARRLPSVRVKSFGATFSTVDEITWEAGTPTEESRLTARFRVAVTRGPLEGLALQVSPGYRVAAAEQGGEDGPLTVKEGRIELARPGRTGESVEVAVKLVGPRSGPGVAVPFPQVGCRDAAGREGSYTVVAPAGYDASATAPPAGKSANPPRLRYPLRGRAPNAALTLTPHAARLTGTSETAVTLIDGKPCRVTAFRLAAVGTLGEVRLRVPRGDGACVRPEGLAARVNAASPVDPWVPALGATTPLAALALSAAAATGDAATEVQRVTLPPADVTGAVIRVRAFADAAGNFPDALPTVIAARIVPAAAAPVEPPGDAGPTAWSFRGLTRTVAVEADGGVTVAVGGVLVTGGKAEWRVAVPPGVTLLGATAYGKSIDSARVAGDAVVLPPQVAPAGGVAPPEMPFEVRLRLPDRVPPLGGAIAPPAVALPGDPPLPTAWELPPEYRTWPRLDAPADGTRDDGPVTVVPVAVPVALGWAGAALLLGAAFTLASRRRLSRGLLVGVCVAALALVATLPPGWALALRPVTLSLFLLAAVGLLAPLRPRAGLLALGLGLSGVAGAALTAEPQTVLVVAGPGERWTVYAARSTLDEFTRLSRPAVPTLAVTGVDYVGRGGATGTAQFQATITLASAGDGAEVYELPLGGVRLDSVELDGKPALPEATRPDAYAVRVAGRGPHTLVARFRVPTVAADGGREARFTGPDFPATRLTFRSPAANVAVLSRRGAQSVEKRDGETVVTADHGGGRAVAVRTWDAPAAATPVASVREGHLWDIGEADATLSSAFQWTVSSGTLSGVAVEVPADLEPNTPTLRAGGPQLGGAAAVRSVTLTPAGAGRRLAVEFAAPLAGKFALLVKFSPRSPLVAWPALALPRSLTAEPAETLVGLRVRGLTLDAVEKRGLIDFPADELTRRFGAPPEWQLDRAPADRVMQRLPGPTAELRPTLRPKPEVGVVACETRWTLGPAVEVEAQVAVTRFSPADSVELDWPEGATLREVRSPELHGWSKSGGRVQVWFRAPTRQAVVTLVGTSPAAPPVVGATLDLGAVRAAGVLGTSVLRVRPPAGTEARWVPGKGVALRPDSTPAETLLTLDAGASAGRIVVVPLPAVEPPRPKPPARVTPPPPGAPAAPAEAVPDTPPGDDWASARGWLVALSWPLGLLAVAAARWRGLRAPECLAACGMLGWGLAGTATFLGLLALAAGAVGLSWRLARLAARASRLVLR